MILWKQHKNLSSEFLTKHHDLVLYDIFHRIKALLLFPPNCSCEAPCQCSEWRKKIILTLNTNLYTKACQVFEKPNRLSAMKALWRLPEDHFFRALHAEAYPVWAIEKELKEREGDDHFKIIDQLVWTFLRLGKTAISYSGRPAVSVEEVFKLFKKPPPGTKKTDLKKDERRCGKKEYEKQFKHYKSVCHFIAAFDMWKNEVPDWEKVLSAAHPPLEHIKRFLKLAHWFRKQLLSLKRRNVKENIFLLEEDIYPLPLWVQSDDIDFPIEPFEEKIREMWSKAVLIDPETKIAIPYLID